MSRPHAAMGTFAKTSLPDRITKDGFRKAAFISQIAPGRRAGPGHAPVLPARRDRHVGEAGSLRLRPDRLGGNEADQIGGANERIAEGHPVEPLDQREHIALGLGLRIEPALAAMDDDDDRVAAAMFHRAARALLHINGEAGFLQHGRAGHLVLQMFNLFCFHPHFRAPRRPTLQRPSFSAGSRDHTRQPRRAEPARARAATDERMSAAVRGAASLAGDSSQAAGLSGRKDSAGLTEIPRPHPDLVDMTIGTFPSRRLCRSGCLSPGTSDKIGCTARHSIGCEREASFSEGFCLQSSRREGALPKANRRAQLARSRQFGGGTWIVTNCIRQELLNTARVFSLSPCSRA